MKSYINALAMVLLISSKLCMAAQVYTYNPVSMWYEMPADYSIVNAIKAKSDLSQADVDKYKLLLLGGFQNVAAAGLGAAATYVGGTKAYEGLDRLGSYAPSDNNKFWWALAGAAGIGLGAYKFLYPRIQAGILQQVKTFIDMCENLDIYNFSYPNLASLGYLGTSQINRSGIAYNSTWNRINTAWTSNNIARKKGLDNLLEQCRAVIQLIAQLHSPETNNLSIKATGILVLLDEQSVNYKTIMTAAQLEAQERARKVAAGQAVVNQEIQLAQKKANVQVAQQQASALWYGKISLGVTAMSNFVDKSFKTLVYVNDKKYEIAGGVLALILLPSLISKTVQGWYFSK